MINFPVLRELMNYAGKMASVIILRQDKRVVEKQFPKKSGMKMDEHLIMGDKPIIDYRRHRQFLIDSNPK